VRHLVQRRSAVPDPARRFQHRKPPSRRFDGSTVRVFDFDDCGYGPTSFDIANALYMVLFDVSTAGYSGRYEAFAASFLAGYERESQHPSIAPSSTDSSMSAFAPSAVGWTICRPRSGF